MRGDKVPVARVPNRAAAGTDGEVAVTHRLGDSEDGDHVVVPAVIGGVSFAVSVASGTASSERVVVLAVRTSRATQSGDRRVVVAHRLGEAWTEHADGEGGVALAESTCFGGCVQVDGHRGTARARLRMGVTESDGR